MERVRAGEEIGPGGGVRYRATAFLGGRPFDVVTIDIGFLDPLAAEPDLLTGPDLLRFAGIPPATIPVAPLEQQVAEKVHAYTRRYGRGEASSRPRDLIDLVLIADLAEFEASRLREAIERTFAARATHELPGELPPPPEQWARPYRRLAEEVGLDPDLAVGFDAARAFVEPVLAGGADVRTWLPAERRWGS